jgi:hypothetical protein
MATRIFTPQSTLTAQVVTVTVGGTILEGEEFAIDVQTDALLSGGFANCVAPAAPTAENIIDALVAAWSGTDWTVTKDSATTLLITAATAGQAFYCQVTTDSAGGHIEAALTTPNASPTDWNNPANWSGGAVPANGDDVILVGIENGEGILQGLLHDGAVLSGTWVPSTAMVTLGSLKRLNSFNGAIGTSSKPLRIGASAVSIGQASGSPFVSGLMNLDLVDSAAVVDVHNAPVSGASGLTLGINDDAAQLRVWSGYCTLSTYHTNQSNKLLVGASGSVTGGRLDLVGTTPSAVNLGGTIDIINKSASSYTLTHVAGSTTIGGSATCSALNSFAGTVRQTPDDGAAAVTAANVYGGTAYLVGSTGTLTIFPDAVADYLSAIAALTITTIVPYQGGTYRIDPALVTVTNSPLTKAYAVEMQA